MTRKESATVEMQLLHLPIDRNASIACFVLDVLPFNGSHFGALGFHAENCC